MVRAFVAVPIPESVTSWVVTVQQELRRICHCQRVRASFPKPENLHLTLKFLGDVPMEQMADISAALSEQDYPPPFEICFSELGAFPGPQKPRVFWLGVEKGAATLKTLAEQVDRGTAVLGFAPESRSFRPHLTLARVRSAPNSASSVLSAVSSVGASPSGLVSKAVLYQSELGQAGAKYIALKSVQFSSER